MERLLRLEAGGDEFFRKQAGIMDKRPAWIIGATFRESDLLWLYQQQWVEGYISRVIGAELRAQLDGASVVSTIHCARL